MNFLITILSIYVFIITIEYAFFEIKEQKNKYGGITIILISFISLLISNILLYLK